LSSKKSSAGFTFWTTFLREFPLDKHPIFFEPLRIEEYIQNAQFLHPEVIVEGLGQGDG
jgi:hypothetical protein